MASISSLCYARSTDAKMQETKSGAYVYAGEAWNFHEWEFRTLLKARALRTIGTSSRVARDAADGESAGAADASASIPRSSRVARDGSAAGESMEDGETMSDTVIVEESRSRPNAQERSITVTKIVEGLRGDAFDVARDLGEDVLCGDDGLIMLVDAMRTTVFPLKAQEVKELLKHGTKPGGLLSRQAGESMTSYVSRRKRWWRLLTQLDHEIMLSDAHRADLLLDLSGLDAGQRLMLMSSIQNNRSFSKIAEALVLQHSAIHRRESRAGGNSKSYGSSWKGGKAKDSAFVATDSYQDKDDFDKYADYGLDHVNNDPAQEDSEEAEADYAEDEPEAEVSDEHEAGQLNALADVLEEFADDDLQDAGYVSTLIQTHSTAMNAWGNRGKGKGKRKGKKKFGPKPTANFGSSAKKPGYPVKQSTLSIQDRRKKLQELKAKSKCRRCGETGHWQGDPACKGTVKPTARLAIAAAAYHSHEALCPYHSDDSPTGRYARNVSMDDGDDAEVSTSLVAVVQKVTYGESANPEEIALPASPQIVNMSDSPGVFPDTDHPDDHVSDLHYCVEGNTTKITWGKYRGKTYGYVLQHHTSYVVWAKKLKDPSTQIQDLLDWCDKYFSVDNLGNISWRREDISWRQERDTFH